MEIKVRIAEEKDVERVSFLYERLHDYLETHENHPRWKRGIYPTKANAEEGFEKGRREEKFETARNLKSLGMTSEQIMQVTGLSLTEIESL